MGSFGIYKFNNIKRILGKNLKNFDTFIFILKFILCSITALLCGTNWLGFYKCRGGKYINKFKYIYIYIIINARALKEGQIFCFKNGYESSIKCFLN